MNVSEDAWNEWVTNPVTREMIRELRSQYTSEVYAAGEAIAAGKQTPAQSGRIQVYREILALLKAVTDTGQPLLDPDDQDLDAPDPATQAQPGRMTTSIHGLQPHYIGD